jgi:hypothetical protein
MHMYELNIVHRYKEAFVTLAFQKHLLMVPLCKDLLLM